MVDYIKITNIGLTPDKLQNRELLSFTERYDTTTGEIVPGSRIGKYKDIWFSISTTGFVGISGSLHKFYNEGLHNYDDFSFEKLEHTIEELRNLFGFNPQKATLNNIEFGVNIELPYNPDLLLDSIVSHRQNQFNINFEKKMSYAQVKYAQYYIKIYNKGLQYNLSKNILRFEIKVIRMAKIAKYGIRTLADLACKGKLIMIKHLLQEAFDDIIFWDKKIDYHALKQKERDLYWLGSSHKFWKGHYEETGSNAIKKVRQFQDLICRHSSLNLNLIRELISDKWDYLIQSNEGIIRDFTDSSSQSQSEIVRDFTGSNVHTPGESIQRITTCQKINESIKIKKNTSFSNLSIAKDLVSPIKKKRVCIVTGINISMQKGNSRFLSIEIGRAHV